METLLKTSAKFIETRTRQIKSDVSKMLASEKAESWLISLISVQILKSLRSTMRCSAMVPLDV